MNGKLICLLFSAAIAYLLVAFLGPIGTSILYGVLIALMIIILTTSNAKQESEQ